MPSFQHLLVGTDFSEPAHNAAARAARLSLLLQANLTLLHVIDSVALRALEEVFGSGADTGKRLQDNAHAGLRAMATELASGHLPDCHVRIGTLIDEIVAEMTSMDMLVLGARGDSPFRDAILGTTAERLLRKSLKPVLVVKRPPQADYRSVLVPMDFSLHAMAALQAALALAPQASIFLLHAFDVPFEGPLHRAGVPQHEIEGYRMRARTEATTRLAGMSRDIGGRHVHVLVEHGSPTLQILSKAEEIRPDLIAMGKHGQSLMEELFIGSVTRHVLADAECDVLVTHGLA